MGVGWEKKSGSRVGEGAEKGRVREGGVGSRGHILIVRSFALLSINTTCSRQSINCKFCKS